MKRKTILAIILFFIVQALVTGACCKLSADSYALRRNLENASAAIDRLTKDVETVFGWTNAECNEKVRKLQELNVYCTRARIIRIDLSESAEHWIAHVEKYGYKQTEVEPEFSYYYFTDNSLFAYRWEYKDTTTDYATLYIHGKCYYFERVIK